MPPDQADMHLATYLDEKVGGNLTATKARCGEKRPCELTGCGR